MLMYPPPPHSMQGPYHMPPSRYPPMHHPPPMVNPYMYPYNPYLNQDERNRPEGEFTNGRPSSSPHPNDQSHPKMKHFYQRDNKGVPIPPPPPPPLLPPNPGQNAHAGYS